MAYTEGVFTPSKFGDMLIKEQELLGEGSRMNELKKPIVAGQAILMHQNPSISEMWAGEQCIAAKVVALRACETTIVDDSGDDIITCDVPAGVEAGSEAIQLEKTLLTNPARFVVWDDQCHNAFSAIEETAYHKLKAKVDLEVELTRAALALAAANADTPNAGWFETPGTVVSDTFQIDSDDFKSDLIADILAASQITDMYDAIIINGRNFFNDAILAQYKGIACCDNDSILNEQNYFQLYWDLRNPDQVLSGRYTLAVDKNSLLFWSSPLWTNAVPERRTGDVYTWSETLPRFRYMANNTMNNIFVDVKAKRVCRASNNIERYGWQYELALRPNCDGRKGIIKIEQVFGS